VVKNLPELSPDAIAKYETPSGVFVIVPVLNEIENISALLEKLRLQLKTQKYLICFIDDGSTDGTLEFIEGQQKNGVSDIHLIRRKKTVKGSQRGSALKEGLIWGLDNTQFGTFVEMDGDLSHRPEEMRTGIRLIQENDSDVAVASKYVPGSKVTKRSAGRKFVSHVSSIAVSFLVSRRIKDYSNGFRFYNRKAAEIIREHNIRYSSPIYLTEVLALWIKNGLRVMEFPTLYIGRNEGLSKLRIVDLVKASLAIFEISLRYHSGGFFSNKTAYHRLTSLLRKLCTYIGRATGDIVPDVPVPPCPSYKRWITWFFISLVLAFSFLYSFFMDRTPVFDEIGLHNPVYMYLHYGKMTYPMHGDPEFMVVHPPVHYLWIAYMMKLGMNLFQAAGVPVFLLIVLSSILIARSRFTSEMQIGLVAAMFFTIFIWGKFYSVRPDLHVTLAWFAGLISLESSRLDGWSKSKLFLGSFLSFYAAGIHYWGVAAASAPIIYGAMMIRSEGFKAAKGKLGFQLAGISIFLLPYISLFVIPNYQYIKQMIQAVQGDGGALDAYKRHMTSYESFSQWAKNGWALRPTSTFLNYPVFAIGIPAAFLSVLLLFIKKKTRLLALAGCILPMFVLFFSQRKQIGYTGYFMPEFLLFSFAFILFLFISLNYLLSKILPLRIKFLSFIIPIALLAYGIVKDVPTAQGNKVHLTSYLKDLDIARASNQFILGKGALLATNSAGVWYTAGGTHIFNPWPELYYPKYLSINLREYLSKFDAIVVDNTWWNNQAKAVPFPKWYVDGIVHLKGFFFNNSRGHYANDLSMFFVSAIISEPEVGFCFKDKKLFRFRKRPDGEYVFAALVCPSKIPKEPFMEFYSAYSLDQPADDAPHLVTFISKKDTYVTRKITNGKGFSERDVIQGSIERIDVKEMLEHLRENDETIHFHKNLSDAINAARGKGGKDAEK
jgi:dolichol-phosphate mannosyltransferase